jgi:hypothetical protein
MSVFKGVQAGFIYSVANTGIAVNNVTITGITILTASALSMSV